MSRLFGVGVICAVYLFAIPAPVFASDAESSAADAERLASDFAAVWSKDSYEAAVEHFKAAAEFWRSAGDHRKASECLRNAGNMEFRLSRQERAIETLRSAVAEGRRANDPDVTAKALARLAYPLIKTGSGENARLAAEEAVELTRNSSDESARAAALDARAEYFYFMFEFEKSSSLRQASLDSWLKTGRLHDIAYAELALAFEHLGIGEPVDALKMARAAEARFLELGDPRGTALSRIAVGQVKSRTGEKQRSLDAFRLAEAGFPDGIDLDEHAQVASWIGTIYEDLSNWGEALRYRTRALEYNRKDGYEMAETFHTATLVWINYRLNNVAEAEARFAEFQARLAEHPNDFLLAITHKQIAESYFAKGEYEKAEEHYTHALPTLQRFKSKLDISLIEMNLGSILAARGRTAEAREKLISALETCRLIGNNIGSAEVLYRLGALERDAGNLSDALKYAEESVALTDRVYFELANSKVKVDFFSSVFDRSELYIDLLMGLHFASPSGGYDRSALQVVERTRARAVLEKMNEARAEVIRDADPAAVARENELLATLNAKTDLLVDQLARESPADQTAALQEEIARLEHDLAETRAEIRRSSPQYSALKAPPSFDVDAFRNSTIDADSVLLEYSLGAKASYLWLVDRGGMSVFPLPPRAEIERQIVRVLALLRSRKQESEETLDVYLARVAAADRDYLVESANLSQTLLGPVAGRIASKRLFVVPDGKLNYLPFGALPSPGVDATEPLLVTNEIAFLPSAQSLDFIKGTASPRTPVSRDLLIVSDPVFSANDARLTGVESASERSLSSAFRLVESLSFLPRLKGSEFEAESVIDAVGSGEADHLSGFEATRDSVLSRDVSRYRIIHFATHGIVDEERPEVSGIVLSRFDRSGGQIDQFVRMQDIYGMRLNADLVVLSACQTGLGKDVRGEGIMSLDNAFLQAGARSVVGSLWQVEDTAARQLMTYFYQGIVKGETAGQALQQAKLKLRQDPRYASPFFWAAFTIHGDLDSRPGVGRLDPRKVVLPLGAVAVILAIVLYRRKRRPNATGHSAVNE
jgi:CHAT domain-containing protein